MNFRKFIPVIFLCAVLVSCSKPGDMTINSAIEAYKKQDYESSLNLFLKALDEETNYSDEIIYAFISNLYLAQEDIANAIKYEELSLALKEDYRGLVTLGMHYHLLGNDEKAFENYQKAINLNPNKGEAYASLGSMYLGQEKIDEAIESLEKAHQLEPNLSVIPANIAVAYAMKGDEEKSYEMLKKAESLKCPNLDDFRDKIEEILGHL